MTFVLQCNADAVQIIHLLTYLLSYWQLHWGCIVSLRKWSQYSVSYTSKMHMPLFSAETKLIECNGTLHEISSQVTSVLCVCVCVSYKAICGHEMVPPAPCSCSSSGGGYWLTNNSMPLSGATVHALLPMCR